MNAYNPTVLPEILKARNLSFASVSRSLGLEPESLTAALVASGEPDYAVLKRLASELRVPAFTFFMDAPPPLPDLPKDWRSESPQNLPKSSDTIRAIDIASSIQGAMRSIRPNRSEFVRATVERIKSADFAQQVRQLIGLTVGDQIQMDDGKSFFYLLRSKIENRGILVLQYSFDADDGSGFCLHDAEYPVIVINTKNQNHARRSFTLAHELAHVILGESGFSDPFVARNSLERACNRFAINFLAPVEIVNFALAKIQRAASASIEYIAKIANMLKISQEATVIRLQELNYIAPDSYAAWKAQVARIGNPDWKSPQGGGNGARVPPEKVKTAIFGTRFAVVFSRAIREGIIDEIDLFRISGLKPAYQSAYFSYATSADPTDVE